MDCMMPLMDGYEACKLQRLRESSQRIAPYSIYALSADTTIANQEKCKQIGFTDFFSKPVQCKELRQILRKNL